jgi:hypothetical protein
MTISMLQEFFRYEENEKEHINDILILLEYSIVMILDLPFYIF